MPLASSFVAFIAMQPTRKRNPGLSFAIIVTSIFLTIGLSIWEARSARALASSLLQADAARIRSDTLVSGAVLAGLVGVRWGFPIVDPLASVLVAAIIAWTAARIVQGASRVLADAAVGDTEGIAKVACTVAGVAIGSSLTSISLKH
jgi:divalent metal cation (Fe/Co/Zn/Cd) transporter